MYNSMNYQKNSIEESKDENAYLNNEAPIPDVQIGEQTNSDPKSKKSKTMNQKLESKKVSKIIQWTKEDDEKLFSLYKQKGACWSTIALEFNERNESQVKNRFYSTLRRLATKEAAEQPSTATEVFPKTKKRDLLKYVDEALVEGHNCRSKRGRKRKMKKVDNLFEDSKNGEESESDNEEIKENEEKKQNNINQEKSVIIIPTSKAELISKNNETLDIFEQKMKENWVLDLSGDDLLAKASEELKELLDMKQNISLLLANTHEVVLREEPKMSENFSKEQRIYISKAV